MYPHADASAGDLHLDPNAGQSHHNPHPSVACGWERVGQEGVALGWWGTMAERLGMVAEGCLMVIAVLCRLYPVNLGVAVVAG